ncbi:MAG: hypothetical protein JWN15_4101 [Firmicutes bacterium]|nr:hypothetical protein [Bacillota bacterium]
MARQGIGLVIGDTAAVAAGLAPDGTEWSVAQPVAVCAPSSSATVELLLAGDEAKTAGLGPSLLAAPRRWGYVTGSPDVARDLLAALLSTVRQQVPPACLERPSYPPVLVLSHRVTAAAAEVVAQAAMDAGWGKVRIVSELAALAVLQASLTDGETVSVACVDGAWVQEATFAGRPTDGGYVLELAALTAQRGGVSPPPSEAPSPAPTEPPNEVYLARGGAPVETDLARGGARLAACQEQVTLSVAPEFPLMIELVADDGAVVVLGPAGEPARYVRALQVPDPDGSLIRLTAVGQILFEAVVEPVSDDAGPWLLQADVAEGRRGEIRLTAADGTIVVNRPFLIRLP